MENQKEFIGYLIKQIRKYLYHNKITRDVKFNEDSVINCSDCEIEIIGDKSLEEQSVNENRMLMSINMKKKMTMMKLLNMMIKLKLIKMKLL
jgi:hypothetical protein